MVFAFSADAAQHQGRQQPVCGEAPGRPLPETTTQTVGTAGGTLHVGPHQLRIERDALTQDVEFAFTEFAGEHIRLEIRATSGEHITFAHPARLEINLRPRCPGSVRPQGLSIYRVAGENMTRLDTDVPMMSARLRAFLDSNSFYIIAD